MQKIKNGVSIETVHTHTHTHTISLDKDIEIKNKLDKQKIYKIKDK